MFIQLFWQGAQDPICCCAWMPRGSPWVGQAHGGIVKGYLFFSLPLGRTEVVGGVGRVEPEAASLGALVSFFGFFVILLLRCSPFGMNGSF